MPSEWDTPPEGPGFYLTFAQLAEAVELPLEDVVALVEAFRLDEDPQHAELIPNERDTVVLFGNDAAARLMELIDAPPPSLGEEDREVLRRVRAQLDRGGR